MARRAQSQPESRVCGYSSEQDAESAAARYRASHPDLVWVVRPDNRGPGGAPRFGLYVNADFRMA